MRPIRIILLLTLLAALSLSSITSFAQAPADCVNRVTVWDNDSLGSIARANGVNQAELAQLNGLAPNARLRIGDVLCLDGLVTARPAPEINTGGAITVPDDTDKPAEVGSSAGVDEEAEGAATPIQTYQGFTFWRGQSLPPSEGMRIHTVIAGDRLGNIANAYGVNPTEISRLNNIDNPALIFNGESLLIPPVLAPLPPRDLGTESPAVTEPPTSQTPNTGGALTEPPALSQPSSTGGATTPPASTIIHQPAVGTIPTVNISPRTAAPGDTITFSGSNFPGNEEVRIYIEKQSQNLASTVITSTTTQADGTFTTSVTIPATWANGTAVTQNTVSVSGYTDGGFWAMDFFVNRPR